MRGQWLADDPLQALGDAVGQHTGGAAAVPRRGMDRVGVQAELLQLRPALGIRLLEQRVVAQVQHVEDEHLHRRSADQLVVRLLDVHA